MNELMEYMPFLIPVIILELVLMVTALFCAEDIRITGLETAYLDINCHVYTIFRAGCVFCIWKRG